MAGRNIPGMKRANAPVEYTKDKLLELVKCQDNPIYFIKTFVKIRHPTKGVVPFILYDYQEKIIDMIHNNRWSIILSARQTGKTETIAAYILWRAMFNDKKEQILCVSKDSNGAKEIIDRIRKMYLEIPDHIKTGVSPDAWNKHTVEFDNGSKIISLATSANASRGLSPSLVFADEFAWVRANIQKEFWAALLPTLSTGGSCIIASTPNGDTDLFSSLYTGADLGNNGFKRVFVPWNAPPGRDEEFKRDAIAKMGKRMWDQEYECKFITANGSLIDDMILNNIQSKINDMSPFTKIMDVEIWSKINPRCSYIVTCDPATGTGLDNSAIQVVEFPTMRQVAEYASNSLDSGEIYSKIKNICSYITSHGSEVYFAFEQNGVGEGIAALYANDYETIQATLLNAPSAGKDGKRRLGFYTDPRNKLKFCLQLKKIVESGAIQIVSKDLILELKRFVRDGQTYSAQPGANDDRVMALILVLRAVEQMSDFSESAYSLCYSFNNSEKEDWEKFHNKEEDDEDYLPLPSFV